MKQETAVVFQGENAPLRSRLMGALIGLARATEGNEFMLNVGTDSVLVEGLHVLFSAESQREALAAMYERVEAEKRRLVPDCYNCASPCGRNNDYDISRLQNTAGDIKALKEHLLSDMRELSDLAYRAALMGRRDDAVHGFLYKALFFIGAEDWGREVLLPVVQEAAEMKLRCAALCSRGED